MRSQAVRFIAILVVSAAVGLTTVGLTATPAAALAAHPARLAVPDGVNLGSLPDATAIGATPATIPETVSIVLKPRNAAQLAATAQSAQTAYLSTAQFAAEYGQTFDYIFTLVEYLGSYRIDATVYPDYIDVHAHGTAAEFDLAFGTQQRDYLIPSQSATTGAAGVGAQVAHSPTSLPSLPAALAENVEAVFGLADSQSSQSEAVHLGAQSGSASTATSASTVCQTATRYVTDPGACRTPSSFANAYGLAPLYTSGAEGQGQTIGIVTLAPLNTTAPEHFWTTVLHMVPSGRTVTTVTVDGGPSRTPEGSSETDLDTEQSGALAPDADIVVYQAPPTTAGNVDAFFTAASANVASSVSFSWGVSETILESAEKNGLVTSGYVGAFDEAFEEMAVQGQSVFVASGDTGAYSAHRATTTVEVTTGFPATSPYVTATGGTTMPLTATISSPWHVAGLGTPEASISVTSQRAWGWDYLWQARGRVTNLTETGASRNSIVGGGGGYSAIEPMPAYQQRVPGIRNYSFVEYLEPMTVSTTPTTGIVYQMNWRVDGAPKVEHATSSAGRAVPDLSADADPMSGYLLYGPTLTDGGWTMSLEGGWGGTSFVAPQMNGATAVIDSALGHRVGLWNPEIYAFAQGPSSPFTPLDTSGTTNDNLYYTGTPGTIYNPATGLGVPNLAHLEADFAKSGVGRG